MPDTTHLDAELDTLIENQLDWQCVNKFSPPGHTAFTTFEDDQLPLAAAVAARLNYVILAHAEDNTLKIDPCYASAIGHTAEEIAAEIENHLLLKKDSDPRPYYPVKLYQPLNSEEGWAIQLPLAMLTAVYDRDKLNLIQFSGKEHGLPLSIDCTDQENKAADADKGLEQA